MKNVLLGTVALAAVAASPAWAADLPTPAPQPVYTKAPVAETLYDWTGFYIGGHFSYSWSHSSGQTTDTANGRVFAPGSTDTQAAHGGGQIGFDYMLPSRVVIGIQGAIGSGAKNTVTNINATQTVTNTGDNKLNWSVRGRLGYAFDKLLVYGIGGVGWNDATATRTQVAGTMGNATPGTVETVSTSQNSWSVGTGLEYAFLPNWDAFAEYRYGAPIHSNTVVFPLAQLSTTSTGHTNSVEVGINWRFNYATFGGAY
jgi:outer membrane immunogenic protein